MQPGPSMAYVRHSLINHSIHFFSECLVLEINQANIIMYRDACHNHNDNTGFSVLKIQTKFIHNSSAMFGRITVAEPPPI